MEKQEKQESQSYKARRTYVKKITKEECSICYQKIKVIGQLECQHNFCIECIKHWLIQVQKCPICKKGVKQLIRKANNQNQNKEMQIDLEDLSIDDEDESLQSQSLLVLIPPFHA